MEFSLECDYEEFASFLSNEGLHDDVVHNVIDNRITSTLFIELRENDLKELAPATGDRLALRKVLEKVQKVIIRHPTMSTLFLVL